MLQVRDVGWGADGHSLFWYTPRYVLRTTCMLQWQAHILRGNVRVMKARQENLTTQISARMCLHADMVGVTCSVRVLLVSPFSIVAHYL